MKKHVAMKRKIQISYPDPDATGSSSDEESEESIKISPSTTPKRTVHEISIDKPRINSALRIFLQKHKRACRQKWRKRFHGGRRRKFRHPVDAEEVLRAFLAKKSELNKLFIANQEIDLPLPSVSQELSDESSSSVHEIDGSVSLEMSSESYNAHEGSGREELVPVSYGVVVNGEFVQLSIGIVVNAEVPYYLPIVDNHGFLLGEFSKLDDLSFCKSEDDSPM